MDASETKQPVILSRQQLYDLVWSTPMTRLAKEFGVDNGFLARVCEREAIPRPPQGFWVKRSAGIEIARLPLPEPKLRPPGATIQLARPTKSAPIASERIKALVASTLRDTGTTSVCKKPARPHPIVAGWIAGRNKSGKEAPANRIAIGNVHDPREFSEIEKRKHRIYDALFKSLERLDGRVRQVRNDNLIVELDGQAIEFLIRQKQKRTSRPPTDEETRERALWGFDKKPIFELIPTNLLAFSFKTCLPGGLQPEWFEMSKKRLEEMLPDILTTFVAAVSQRNLQQLEREEQNRRSLIAELKAASEAKWKLRDDKRWGFFFTASQKGRRR
jgi:hypothetical protein